MQEFQLRAICKFPYRPLLTSEQWQKTASRDIPRMTRASQTPYLAFAGFMPFWDGVGWLEADTERAGSGGFWGQCNGDRHNEERGCK